MPIESLAPLALTVLAQMALFRWHRHAPRVARAASAMLCIATVLRYVAWRVTEGMPHGADPLPQAWAWIYLAFEVATIVSSVLVLVTMSRHKDRSADVEARQNSPLIERPVDVFIATYNESKEILERTILGAQAIDHPDLRVWVLDDKARPWVAELAAELGVEYISRVKGEHAKAGNINNGLKHALSKGRRPEFILVLDADFVAFRNILRRTLGLFEERDVGIVQTPQHFFNNDPLQSNLLCAAEWPDEQRFFFNVLLPAKDAWGCAFCCGTSAVFRVAALEACGGMATETVTEDMLTSFKMSGYGYRTIFLNEALSMGLAPEGLSEYVSQRSRWCLGAIQQLYTRWSFFGKARMGLMNRIAYFDSVLYWTTNAPFKLLLLTGPLIYWFTGITVIRAEIPDLIGMLGPMAIANAMFMSYFAGNLTLPIVTDVANLLSSQGVIGTAAIGLLRPHGHAFKVTAKGVSSSRVTVQWKMFWPFALLAWATLGGMLYHARPSSLLNGGVGYALNVVWSLFSASVFSVAALATIELPKRRGEQRFRSGERAELRVAGSSLPCVVEDISVDGARLVLQPASRIRNLWGELTLDEGELSIPVHILKNDQTGIAVRFETDDATRRRLLIKLHTGNYDNEVGEVHVAEALIAVMKNLFV